MPEHTITLNQRYSPVPYPCEIHNQLVIHFWGQLEGLGFLGKFPHQTHPTQIERASDPIQMLNPI